MFLLIGAFIAGILTVLAPCVLPLLPVIIGGSVSGDTKDGRRPFLIASSLAVSLVAFTILLKATTLLITVPPQVFTYVSGGIITVLGLATLFPFTYTRLIGALGLEHRAQSLLGKGTSSKRQWLGPVITGAALGPVFSSCSPVYAYILATVLPVHFAMAMSYIVSYVFGLTLILLAVGYYGQRLTTRLRFASDPRGVFQRGLGVLFIIVGVLIITGSGTRLQVWAADHTPFNFDGLSSKLIPKQMNAKAPTVSSNSSLYNVQPGVQAPDFIGIQNWINSSPLTLSQLHGKVVLVDFWTYTCINCIRSLPYVEGWYQEYQKDGLVVIGVEAPEFSYEKIPSNVKAAVKQDKITYPVAIDGNLETWGAYQNEYWPAEYLIDQNGNIRRADFGEGEYSQMEQAIRGLLASSSKLQLPGTFVTPGDLPSPVSEGQTPETYLGTDRENAYEGSPILGSSPNYTFTKHLDTSDWSLSGTWSVSGTAITAGQNARLEINVSSKNVYLVGGAPNASPVTVQFNGKPISQTGDAGANVVDSQVSVQLSDLYRIASFPRFTSGIITLDVPSGVSLNTFTFGN